MSAFPSRKTEPLRVAPGFANSVIVKRTLPLAFVMALAVAAQPASQPPHPIGGVQNGPALVASFEQAMIAAPPAELGLDPFYKKCADAFGIPVVSSAASTIGKTYLLQLDPSADVSSLAAAYQAHPAVESVEIDSSSSMVN